MAVLFALMTLTKRNNVTRSFCAVALLLLLAGLVCAQPNASVTGGGDCSASGIPCADFGGTCENGKCVCFDGRTCSHCQSSDNNYAAYGCIDMKVIGGASCTTASNGCEGQGACPNVDWTTPKVCRCFDGRVCPNCQMTTGEYIANDFKCSAYNYTNVQSGGGPCKSPEDCTNFQGECVTGQCSCHSDRTCANCQASIWEVDKLGCVDYALQGGAQCLWDEDCSGPNGKCVDERCLCFTGYMCPQCTLTNEQYVANNYNCTYIDEVIDEPLPGCASALQLAGALGVIAIVNYKAISAIYSY